MKRFDPYCLLKTVVFVLLPALLPAQTDSLTNANRLIVKYTNDFIITGEGSSENWAITNWTNLPQHDNTLLKNVGWNINTQGSAGNNLQYQTAFKTLYSNTGIYCLFKCEDSVMTATLKEDFLNLFKEDVVEVFLKPDSTMPVYFEYELSPLNFELAILIINNDGSIAAWKPWQYNGERKTKHAVKVNEKNSANKRFTWTAEMFIPFALLRPFNNVPPKKATQWRANFYRIDYDRSPVYSGWRLTRKGFHDPEKFGILQFE